MSRFIVFLLALLLAGPAFAAAPRDSLLVTPAWLAAHQHDPALVLLHVGDKKAYARKHIPGAHFVDLDDISNSSMAEGGLMLEMPTAADLRTRLARLGISDTSHIVVYYGQDWISPATRVVFTLEAAGLGDRTVLLDGGMGAWTREGHAVTDQATPDTAGKLSPLRMKDEVVDAAFVQSHLGKPGYVVVDGRSAAFYDGVQTGGGSGMPRHKTGHIAGARSIPFTSVTGADLKFLPADRLAAAFQRAGVKPGDTVIGYCHIGQQATAMLFAARTLGFKTLLYDGAFEDWSRRNLPVENPSQRAAR